MTTTKTKNSGSPPEAPWERIFADYVPDPLRDDEYIYRCKEALMNLREPDRNLLIRYAEEGTYAGVAKRYHMPVSTIKYKIEQIRKAIFGYGNN